MEGIKLPLIISVKKRIIKLTKLKYQSFELNMSNVRQLKMYKKYGIIYKIKYIIII